jgi:hypothetical protein
VTDGVFVPAADDAGCDAPPAFLPARPITAADLAALTVRVRRRVIRWFRMQQLLDAAAAADMLTWENSGFSVDASVRITLNRPRRAKLLLADLVPPTTAYGRWCTVSCKANCFGRNSLSYWTPKAAWCRSRSSHPCRCRLAVCTTVPAAAHEPAFAPQ